VVEVKNGVDELEFVSFLKTGHSCLILFVIIDIALHNGEFNHEG